MTDETIKAIEDLLKPVSEGRVRTGAICIGCDDQIYDHESTRRVGNYTMHIGCGLKVDTECEWCGTVEPLIDDETKERFAVEASIEGLYHKPCLRSMIDYRKVATVLTAIGWTRGMFLDYVDLLAGGLKEDDET
jgi:hypothetical protein